MSKFHFLRVFRRVTGVTPYKYLLSVRLKRAAVTLLSTDDAVSAIAYSAGFGDLSTFNHRFRDVFGLTPTAFRQAGTS
jgi:AraC-like DNA-binding protein